jgi:alpha-1,2-mannosyltransferase
MSFFDSAEWIYAWNASQLIVYFSALALTLRFALKHADVRSNVDKTLMLVAALGAFLCWSLIVQFVIDDVTQLQAVGKTQLEVVKSKRFVKCYTAVVDSEAKWFFSQQLLFSVVVLVAYLLVQSVRTRVDGVWRYVVLGELMAISVAAPLALIHLRSRPQIASTPYVSGLTILAFVLALLSTFATPLLAPNASLFKFNLFLLHVVLVLPFLRLFGFGAQAPPESDERHRRARVAVLYALIAGAAIVAHASAALSVWRANDGDLFATVGALVDALFLHPCQTSISIDAGLVWLLMMGSCLLAETESFAVNVATLVAAQFLGGAGTAALFLAIRELQPPPLAQRARTE